MASPFLSSSSTQTSAPTNIPITIAISRPPRTLARQTQPGGPGIRRPPRWKRKGSELEKSAPPGRKSTARPARSGQKWPSSMVGPIRPKFEAQPGRSDPEHGEVLKARLRVGIFGPRVSCKSVGASRRVHRPGEGAICFQLRTSPSPPGSRR